MKILKLKLYTNKFDLEKKFYSETLGFKIIKQSSNLFTLKIGWSELTFAKSKKEHIYHYCFLIPSNKIIQAMEWVEKRVPVIDIENGRKIQKFESWNAESFYFYDASGNIAEFIVRNELNNSSNSDFDVSDVLCVNEIGMPTNDVEKTNNELQENLGSKFWKGDLKVFGTNGSLEGLFLLPNYNFKEIWFPTSIKTKPEPFEVVIESNGKKRFMEFNNEEIKTTTTMTKKHIVIVGLGGVGGYFGFKINQSNEKYNQHKISFIARGKTYNIVKKNGLTLLSPEHPVSKTKPNAIHQNISDISKPDLVFICVKEYDLENVCNQLSKVITKNTILLPMMNGADIYDRIRKIMPNNIILPSCVYVASHIKEKGIVEHKGKAGKLIFGKDPKHTSEDIDWIVDLIISSTINFEFKENSLVDIWTKFIFIASFGLVTAKYNSSIGAVCTNELQKEEAAKIMNEIKSIADRKGIHLQDNIIQKTFKKASTFPPKTPTSLQLDVNSRKENNELELFAGAIIKYGKELNINTPFTESVYQEIKATIN